MPYSDIQHQDSEELLYIYTVKYENGRYDIINHKSQYESYNNQDIGIHSFNYDMTNDSVNNDKKYYYNYYNTYRRDISPESYNVKLNETALFDHTNILNDNYYNIDNNNFNSSINLFNFKGIAINYNFACNGALATLEDIFAEYGYDYIVAKDQERLKEGKDYYYFDRNNSKFELEFAYEIIPIGETYVDDEGVESIIEYDGTTIPNVQQLLSGNLYIVIKSNNQKPRKIYFNNQYIPSLFVNDDKYNEKSIYNKGDDNYKYILMDSQPMKMCDINRYRSWGYIINWLDDFVVFNGNYHKLSSITDTNYGVINDSSILVQSIDNIDINTIEGGIALFVSSILINYDRDNQLYNQIVGDCFDSEGHLITNQLYNVEYQKFNQYLIPFDDNESFIDTSYNNVSVYYPNVTKFFHPYISGIQQGPVLRPKTEIDKATLQITIVPTIYFNDFYIPNKTIVVQKEGIENITLYKAKSDDINNPYRDTVRTYINPIIKTPLSFVTTEYPEESAKNNIFSEIKQIDKTYNNIITEIGYMDTSISVNINDVRKPILPDDNKNDIFSANAITLTMNLIPFQDMKQYNLTEGIIKIAFNTVLNILLSTQNKQPGFFDPVEDPIDYEPVFSEPVYDTLNVEPIFMKESATGNLTVDNTTNTSTYTISMSLTEN